MQTSGICSWFLLLLGQCLFGLAVGSGDAHACIAPKFMIISMFAPEGLIWQGIPEFNLLEQNITIPGLSPLFPAVHCTGSGEICQVITGEAEINAASTITALVLSPRFNLTQTYFMIGGIGGVNPGRATLNDVVFSRYAVQVALQYEIDPRELPANYSAGYIPFGTVNPAAYPQQIYGSEVFELNTALQRTAARLARKATLNDTAGARNYRAHYPPNTPGSAPAPSVRECDTATSDVYYSGTILGAAFDNFTTLVTNGTGRYCMTAQEDNASLEALVRGDRAGLLDFKRVMLMRTASDMAAPYPGESAPDNLFYYDQGSYECAVSNIYHAGVEVVAAVVRDWDATFKKGIAAPNYVGDILDSLGGTPNFGLPSQYATGALARRASRPFRRAR